MHIVSSVPADEIRSLVKGLITESSYEFLAVRVSPQSADLENPYASLISVHGDERELTVMVSLLASAKAIFASRRPTDNMPSVGMWDRFTWRIWADPGDVIVAMPQPTEADRAAFELMVVPGQFYDLYEERTGN